MFKDPAPRHPVVLEVFVRHALDKLIEDIIYGLDTTFTTKNQLIDFVIDILEGLRPVVKQEDKLEIMSKKIVRMKLKPLTTTQNSDTVSDK